MNPLWKLWIIVFGGHFVASMTMDVVHKWYSPLLAGAALGTIVSLGHWWLERAALNGAGK